MTATTPELEGLDCPAPLHRLFNLVDGDLVREFVEDGTGWPCAIIVAALELPEHLYGTAIRLIHATGWMAPAALDELLAEDHHAVLTAFAGVAIKADERIRADRYSPGAHHHRGHRRGKRRR